MQTSPAVKFARLPARAVFNACDPGLLHDVAVWLKDDWWNEKYNPLRDLLRGWFVELFDAETGHYSRLRESIAQKGIVNPIVVTAGPSLWREPWMLPPDVGDYLCESCGGSRLMVAQELGIDIPCIINDSIGVEGEELTSGADVLGKFADSSYRVTFGPPCRVSPKRFTHMPADYTMGKQQQCRRKVKAQMIARARAWLDAG